MLGKTNYKFISSNLAKMAINWQNTHNYLAAARFTRDYLKILNFDTKNLSPPTVFELETWQLSCSTHS